VRSVACGMAFYAALRMHYYPLSSSLVTSA